MKLGEKIAARRKDLGITQEAFANQLFVTRQTVSRWEQGSATPDVQTVAEVAKILGVTCDYLINDNMEDADAAPRPAVAMASGLSRLVQAAVGRKVKLAFFDGEADVDLFNTECTVDSFEGNWMRVVADTKKGQLEKLIPLSAVLSIEFVDDAKEA